LSPSTIQFHEHAEAQHVGVSDVFGKCLDLLHERVEHARLPAAQFEVELVRVPPGLLGVVGELLLQLSSVRSGECRRHERGRVGVGEHRDGDDVVVPGGQRLQRSSNPLL